MVAKRFFSEQRNERRKGNVVEFVDWLENGEWSHQLKRVPQVIIAKSDYASSLEKRNSPFVVCLIIKEQSSKGYATLNRTGNYAFYNRLFLASFVFYVGDDSLKTLSMLFHV